MSVLRNRNFSLLFFGQLVSTFGNNLYSLALPWFVYQTTNSKADLTLSGITVYLPSIAGLFVGVFVDRWSKRRTMLGSDVIRLFIALTMYALVVLKPELWLLFSLVFLIQLVGTVFTPAQRALVPLVVSPEDIAAAAGLNQSGTAATQLISNLSGGFLMTFFGAAQLFLMDAISFLASIISLLFLKVSEPRSNSPKASKSFFDEWRLGFKYMFRHKSVLRVVVTTVLANFALVPTEIVLVAWVKGPLNGQAFDLGITMAAISVGMIVGGFVMKRLSKVLSIRLVLVLGLAATGLCIAIIGMDTSQIYAMVILLIVGFDMGVMNGAIGSFYLLAIQEEFRGRTLSALRAVASLAAPIGTAVYGFLMVHLNLSWVFILLGLPIVVSGVMMLKGEQKTNSTLSTAAEG